MDKLKCTSLHTYTQIFTLVMLLSIITLLISLQKTVFLRQLKPTSDSACDLTLSLANINSESNWGPVDNERTIFVISAYYIAEKGQVFIIGARPLYKVSLICQFWKTSSEHTLLLTGEANAKTVAPTGIMGYEYIPTIYACPIKSGYSHVSLVTRSCYTPKNLLRIRDVSKPVRYQRRFTVCLSPMIDVDDAARFVEWIELNRILGAEKFILYNCSTGPNVEKVIRYYLNSNLVEVVQWVIPFGTCWAVPADGTYRLIESRAQKAAINDCIFRNKNISEFIVNIDNDEFIIPHAQNVFNWSQMMKQFDKNYAGYIVRHSIFTPDLTYKQSKLTEMTTDENLNLVTFTHIKRSQKIWPAIKRSKYFARTAFVEFGYVHWIPRGRIFTIPPEKGLLHHYRASALIIEIGNKHMKVKDMTVPEKFGHRLLQNVRLVLEELSKMTKT